MAEFVRLEVADAVATIRLDRPKLNPLDAQMQAEIRATALEAADRDDIRAVILYGGPKVFAAGADIKEMADMSYTDMVGHSGTLQSSFTAVARIPKPTVAAITGYAPGGSRPTTPSSASRRSRWASCPAPAEHSGCRAWSDRRRPRT